MARAKLALALTLGVLLLILVLQNAEVVEIRFLFWRFELSRVILIFLAATAGFAAGWMVSRLPKGGARGV